MDHSAPPRTAVSTERNQMLWVSALTLLLYHEESGCQRAAWRAARLLDQLAASSDTDAPTRLLCDHASQRLAAGARS